MATKPKATLEDLYNVPEGGKAELVDGELVLMSPTGDWPNRAAGAIYVSLRQDEKQAGGRAYGDNTGFVAGTGGRESFSPDASFYIGPPARMRFLEGAPVFAAEVRGEGDYGPRAERKLAAKRAEYLAAGTQAPLLAPLSPTAKSWGKKRAGRHPPHPRQGARPRHPLRLYPRSEHLSLPMQLTHL